MASGTSIGRIFEERYGRVDPSRPTVGRDVNDLVAAGDERAIGVVHEAGFALGASLGTLANILDPAAIVLSACVALEVQTLTASILGSARRSSRVS